MNVATFDHLQTQTIIDVDKRRRDFKDWRRRQKACRAVERQTLRMARTQTHCQTCGKRFEPDGLFRDRPVLVEAGPHLVCRGCVESGATR